MNTTPYTLSQIADMIGGNAAMIGSESAAMLTEVEFDTRQIHETLRRRSRAAIQDWGCGCGS